MNKQFLQNLQGHFDRCVSDSERWNTLMSFKDMPFTLVLDSGEMHVISQDVDWDWHCTFDTFLGDSDGVFLLLENLGVRVEYV